MVSWRGLITAVCAAGLVMSNFNKVFTAAPPFKEKSVMLVVAHPDDETMFFGPTIRNALQSHENTTLSVLVLSNGNHDGLGETREKEMFRAASSLGINPYNVRVLDDPELQDSPDSWWDDKKIATHVAEAASLAKPDYIITFDKNGVSGHSNHRATFLGVLRYASSPAIRESGLKVLTLDSVPLVRKYIFVFDSVVSRVNNMPRGFFTLISSNYDYYLTRMSLTKGHTSQMTWYRQLWSFFSRYMVVNDLGPVNLERVAASGLFDYTGDSFVAPEATSEVDAEVEREPEADYGESDTVFESNTEPETDSKTEQDAEQEADSEVKSETEPEHEDL